jgi:hypothetical protein
MGRANFEYQTSNVITSSFNSKSNLWIFGTSSDFWFTSLDQTSPKLLTVDFPGLAAVEYDQVNELIVAVGKNRITLYQLTFQAPWSLRIVNQKTAYEEYTCVHPDIQSNLIVVGDTTGKIRLFDPATQQLPQINGVDLNVNKKITRIRQRLTSNFKLVVAETQDLYQIDITNLKIFSKMSAQFTIHRQAQDMLYPKILYIASNSGVLERINWDGSRGPVTERSMVIQPSSSCPDRGVEITNMEAIPRTRFLYVENSCVFYIMSAETFEQNVNNFWNENYIPNAASIHFPSDPTNPNKIYSGCGRHMRLRPYCQIFSFTVPGLLSCPKDTYLFKPSNLCLEDSSFPAGTGIIPYTNQLGACKVARCSDCKSDFNRCSGCQTGFFLDKKEGRCVSKDEIPIGFGGSREGILVECRIAGCVNCLEDFTVCSSCRAGQYVDKSVSACISFANIKPGTGIGQNREIQACTVQSCVSCAADNTRCEGCADNSFLDRQRNKCVSAAEIPAGKGPNERKELVDCQVAGCQSCLQSSEVCEKCVVGKYLFQNTCVGVCPSGFVQDVSTSSCVRPTTIPDGKGPNPQGLIVACQDSACLNCRNNFAQCKKCKPQLSPKRYTWDYQCITVDEAPWGVALSVDEDILVDCNVSACISVEPPKPLSQYLKKVVYKQPDFLLDFTVYQQAEQEYVELDWTTPTTTESVALQYVSSSYRSGNLKKRIKALEKQGVEVDDDSLRTRSEFVSVEQKNVKSVLLYFISTRFANTVALETANELYDEVKSCRQPWIVREFNVAPYVDAAEKYILARVQFLIVNCVPKQRATLFVHAATGRAIFSGKAPSPADQVAVSAAEVLRELLFKGAAEYFD